MAFGRPSHGFGYTQVDQLASYLPTAASGTGITNTTYAHDHDRALNVVTRPNVKQINYDAAGRLSRVTLPSADVANYGYDATTGQLRQICGPYGFDLDYVWDGALLKQSLFTSTHHAKIPKDGQPYFFALPNMQEALRHGAYVHTP